MRWNNSYMRAMWEPQMKPADFKFVNDLDSVIYTVNKNAEAIKKNEEILARLSLSNFRTINSNAISKIIQNGPCVIVFWSDKTKTIVRKRDTDNDDIYSAVAQAWMKKFYGSTTKWHKVVDKALIKNKKED